MLQNRFKNVLRKKDASSGAKKKKNALGTYIVPFECVMSPISSYS